MATTLRRSRSKYGRTRRQRRKQRRIRGGGFFDKLKDDIVNKFKPKSAQVKCEEAEQEAENICNSSEMTDLAPIEQPSSDSSVNDATVGFTPGVDGGDVEMTELAPIEQPSSDASVNDTSRNDATVGFTPGVDGGDVEMTEIMPQSMQPLETSYPEIMPPSMNQPEIEQNPLQPQPLPLPLPQPPAASKFGGSKKIKKKNKKRSQSRRKKLKSRKHKK